MDDDELPGEAEDRGQVDAILTVIPREEEDAEFALKFDALICNWVLQGDASEIAKTAQRQRVLDVLRQEGRPLRAKDIADRIGEKANNITQLLYKMSKEGKVVSDPDRYGHYVLHPLLNPDKSDKTDKT